MLGPAKATKPLAAPPKEAAARLAAVQRVAEEVDLLEKTYQRALESGASAEAAGAMLNRVIEKQRELLRLQPAATTEQTEKLARLEGTRGSQRSRAAQARSLVLEKEAVAAERAAVGAGGGVTTVAAPAVVEFEPAGWVLNRPTAKAPAARTSQRPWIRRDDFMSARWITGVMTSQDAAVFNRNGF